MIEFAPPMNTCNGCLQPLVRLSWNTVHCRECSYMVTDPAARPPYLDRPRHEHPVFQDTKQGHAHAMARALWGYAKALELKQQKLEHQMELLKGMVKG